MRELGLINENRLYAYYLSRIEEAAARHQRRIVGWDALPGGSPGNTAVVISENGLDGALVAAASGYDVVVSGKSLDFGRVQSMMEGTPGEPGMVGLEDVYRFEPAPTALAPSDRQRIIGMQAHVWTRVDIAAEQVGALTFPRAAALAEVAWSAPPQRSWTGFLDRMVIQMQRYATLGVGYSEDAFRVDTIVVGHEHTHGSDATGGREHARRVPDLFTSGSPSGPAPATSPSYGPLVHTWSPLEDICEGTESAPADPVRTDDRRRVVRRSLRR